MPIEILMPALSPTMKEGNLVKWLKKEGDSIASGDVIAEIETDKATMEVEAVDEGTLGKILIPEGTEAVQVNQVIGLILEEDEDKDALKDYTASVVAPTPSPQETSQATSLPQPSAPAPLEQEASSGGRIIASPVAKRLAEQKNVNLSQIKGTGPHNRIIKVDVEKATATSASRTVSSQTLPTYDGTAYADIPLSSMRKVIAERLTQSKQQVPHFYLNVQCELDALLEARKTLNSALENQGIKLSVNDFVIKACAEALQKVPEANASWGETYVRQYGSSDVSVAVAIEGGLITPIVKAAHLKSLTQISQEMKGLAKRARDGKLKPEEFQGGSFSLSNLGMYGIKEFSAVINPPQGAILAVGAGEQQPVIREGAVQIRTLMSCTLSVDHRAIDGAVGAEFLTAIKYFIENPLLMMASGW